MAKPFRLLWRQPCRLRLKTTIEFGLFTEGNEVNEDSFRNSDLTSDF